MAGMYGMKKKGNKKWPTPRQKVIHNPIPTSFFCSVMCSLSYIRQIIDQIHLHMLRILKRNKEVGMGKYECVSTGTVSILRWIILR